MNGSKPQSNTETAQLRLTETDDDVRRCFPVMRELRQHLPDAETFVARVAAQAQGAGYRLAYVEAAGEVVACTGFRITEFLAWGRVLYVDDLVTREASRGRGHGERLMRWLLDRAAAEGCDQLHLDSGTHRLAAHRLYHRVGMGITAFHFAAQVGAGG